MKIRIEISEDNFVYVYVNGNYFGRCMTDASGITPLQAYNAVKSNNEIDRQEDIEYFKILKQ